MFAKFALFVISSLVALSVVAGPVPSTASPANPLAGLTGIIPDGGIVNGAPSTGGVKGRTEKSQCNVDDMQCCSSVHEANSPAGAFLLASFFAPVQNLVANVGFNCAPVAAGVAGGAAGTGSKCSSQPVCCNNPFLDGMVNNACIPLNMQVM